MKPIHFSSIEFNCDPLFNKSSLDCGDYKGRVAEICKPLFVYGSAPPLPKVILIFVAEVLQVRSSLFDIRELLHTPPPETHPPRKHPPPQGAHPPRAFFLRAYNHVVHALREIIASLRAHFRWV